MQAQIHVIINRQSHEQTNTVLLQLFKNVKAKGIRVSPSMEELSSCAFAISPSPYPTGSNTGKKANKEGKMFAFISPVFWGEGVEGLVPVYAGLVTPTQNWRR
jgi:hypothetical protein